MNNVWNRIGLGFALLALFIMLTHLLPEDIAPWKAGIIYLSFNLGVLAWMIPGRED